MRVKKERRIHIVTLGCAKNRYDSEVLMGQLKASGKKVLHEVEEEEYDIVVINTCGFIEAAKQESIDTILHYVQKKEEGKAQEVYVTGCLSERYKKELQKEIPNVDAYFGTKELAPLLKRLRVNYKKELLGERILTTPKSYAYLKISEGCNRKCSFCAIPLMRGAHQSVPIEQLVVEAEKLAAQGVKELILIAQDLSFYGIDLYKKQALGNLLKALVQVDGIAWIRLHYAYPTNFPMEILDYIRDEEKICNYLDIPLQHIAPNMLKAMRRGITKEKTDQLIQKIRMAIPGISLRTTLLLGFPGETQEDFEQLKNWVVEQEFERLGCFAYSHEENTHAYQLKDLLSPEEKQERVDEIMQIQSQIALKHNRQKINRNVQVLIDRYEQNYWVGRTQFDSPEVDNEVFIRAGNKKLGIGEFVHVNITDATNYDLYATVL